MTREKFITLSKDHILYLDGATGSNLVKAGMPSGVCPEQWILEHQRGNATITEGIRAGGNQYPVCPYLYSQSRQTGRISSGKNMTSMIRDLVAISKRSGREYSGTSGLCGR